MDNLLHLSLFTLFYYQLNNILKPCLYDKFEIFQEEPFIFYPVVQSANLFILSIFFLFTTHLLFFSKITDFI